MDEGFRGPVRKRKRGQLDEGYDSRKYQRAVTYHTYAKELCENYSFGRNKYHLCVKEKRFVAITRSDFAKLKEDLRFLGNALKTVLVEYWDYLQKKFFSALAQLLKEQDEANGKCRLRKSVQN